MHDVAVIGAGFAGMATAARLQARGLSTVVLEGHRRPGGCAGWFRRSGFHFDVGATTLVDFGPGGVGGELLDSIGHPELEGERLAGYCAWLPDRRVTLHREQALWARERLAAFGGDAAHARFWALLDALAAAFWRASRAGVALPLRSAGDVLAAVRALGLAHLPLARYLRWTMADALAAHGLCGERPLASFLAMLVEDTVHATLEQAPLVNAALGVTIRGAGLWRARGGMAGFWRRFCAHYDRLGGELVLATRVERVRALRRGAGFALATTRGALEARQVVSSLPVQVTARIAPRAVGDALAPFLARDGAALGGALIAFLGVPEVEVAGEELTHHQLLHDYAAPLGEGNNMFVSVSAPDDLESAPRGQRCVMLSTHCELAPWEGLSGAAYARAKERVGEHLIALARRVYPRLGERALVREVGTPRTYARFTLRPRGAVGGFRLSLANANQRAIPCDLALPGFWLVGDTTWPGLGTVACALGSRIVAERVYASARRLLRSKRPARGLRDPALAGSA